MAAAVEVEEESEEQDCPKCPPVGAPAWMATFADMATLLMAFFVLILSFAEFNTPKFKMISGLISENQMKLSQPCCKLNQMLFSIWLRNHSFGNLTRIQDTHLKLM